MKTPWPVKKLGREHKTKEAMHFLMRDILSCFPTRVEDNLISRLNQHSISKEATKQIFKDEIQNEKSQFRVLAGALILQNSFLRQLPEACDELIDIVPELKYCFYDDQRKTIKKLSAQAISRLFLALYYEYLFLPGKEEGDYIAKFKEYFSRGDIVRVMKSVGIGLHYIFEGQGLKLGFGDEASRRIGAILDEFYSSEGK